jgi:hypothetical protein
MVEVSLNVDINNLANHEIAPHISEADVASIFCPRKDIMGTRAKSHVPNGSWAAFRARRPKRGDERLCIRVEKKCGVEYGNCAVLCADC